MDADFLLIKRMKQGDEVAFEVFVRKYYEEILNYCSYHCFDRTYAEDLTQETFVRFFAKLSDYHYVGKTKNYLYTIAGNLCRDYYKKIKEDPMEEQEINEALGSSRNHEEVILDKMTIEWALRQLPDELYEAAILYYFQDLKLIEIACVLQISLPLAKYRVRRAKMQLERILRKEEELYEPGGTNQEL